jgi:hypothetical protein
MKLHPLHRKFAVSAPVCSVDVLLTLLDSLPAKHRDNSIFLLAMAVVNPKTRAPESIHETLEEVYEEHISHNRFKEKFRQLALVAPEEVLVVGAVHHILAMICNYAFADIDEVIKARQGIIARCRELMENATQDWEIEKAREAIKREEERMRDLPKDFAEWQTFYVTFCEQVLAGVFRADRERVNAAVAQFHKEYEGLSTEPFPGAPKEPPLDE